MSMMMVANVRLSVSLPSSVNTNMKRCKSQTNECQLDILILSKTIRDRITISQCFFNLNFLV